MLIGNLLCAFVKLLTRAMRKSKGRPWRKKGMKKKVIQTSNLKVVFSSG